MNSTVRGAGQWGWLIQNQFTQVHRVQTIGVFNRINTLQHGIFIEMLGQWQLNNVTGTCGISIELINDGMQFFLANIGWQVLSNRLHPHLFAVPVLHFDICMAGGIIPHQHGCQPWRDSFFLECLNASGEIRKNLIPIEIAVKFDCCHGCHYIHRLESKSRNPTLTISRVIAPHPHSLTVC